MERFLKYPKDTPLSEIFAPSTPKNTPAVGDFGPIPRMVLIFGFIPYLSKSDQKPKIADPIVHASPRYVGF